MINKKTKLFLKRLLGKEVVRVYSHPRSGTHFLEAFLAENFYKGKDLNTENVIWGHWSNRKIKINGNQYGKLFGNHYFANRNHNHLPKIYIVRDVRAVAYSVWNTNNFLHENVGSMTFKEFLNYKLDWVGTPSKECNPSQTIIEHWCAHVNSWLELEKSNPNLIIVRYEDLVERPYEVYKAIKGKFFKFKLRISSQSIVEIKDPIGLLPNQGKINSWKSVFDSEDKIKVNEIVPNHLSKFLVNDE